VTGVTRGDVHMNTRKVPAAALPGISGAEWVDTTRRPYVEGGTAWVPVREGYGAGAELPERHPYRGRGYQMIGDIAIVHGREPDATEVAEIVRWCRPRAVLHVGSVDGVMRIPQTTVLYGSPGEVKHRESGCTYWLDPAKVMFAQGNRSERMRIAEIIRMSGREERVADLFAGIGYFTIPAARSGAFVHAAELNPVSFAYLQRNIRENGVENRVAASCGDCRDFLDGEYDRVIMGHFDAAGFIEPVLAHVHPGSVLHLHSTGDVTARIRDAVGVAGFSADISVQTVKKYGPHKWHIVQDVVIS